MLSFFCVPAISNFVSEARGPVAKPSYKALLKTRLRDLVLTTASLHGVTHPRTAADEISTCRS